jgi:DNA polymerase-3 subunit epsilon
MVAPPSLNQRRVAEIARKWIEQRPVYLDTETTGLDKNAEIIEIGVVGPDGEVLFESYVRPFGRIPADAIRLHGITNDAVQNAPAWPLVWPNVREHLLNRPVGIYNAEFDLRLMRQSMERYRLTWRESLNAFDILQLYSEYRGIWDAYKKSYRYFRLEEARRQLGIPIPNAHRAVDDARLARAVLHRLAGLDY